MCSNVKAHSVFHPHCNQTLTFKGHLRIFKLFSENRIDENSQLLENDGYLHRGLLGDDESDS